MLLPAQSCQGTLDPMFSKWGESHPFLFLLHFPLFLLLLSCCEARAIHILRKAAFQNSVFVLILPFVHVITESIKTCLGREKGWICTRGRGNLLQWYWEFLGWLYVNFYSQHSLTIDQEAAHSPWLIPSLRIVRSKAIIAPISGSTWRYHFFITLPIQNLFLGRENLISPRYAF